MALGKHTNAERGDFIIETLGRFAREGEAEKHVTILDMRFAVGRISRKIAAFGYEF